MKIFLYPFRHLVATNTTHAGYAMMTLKITIWTERKYKRSNVFSVRVPKQ